MKLIIILPLCLLTTTVTASPTTTREDTHAANTSTTDNLVITRDFFIETNVKYTSQHDIVNIVVPLNKINFEDDEEDNDENTVVTAFFVEADVNDKGERQYKGLYILKDSKGFKILDNGRDATAFNDDSKKVYIGASDGIYVYDDSDGKTNKCGSLTDNIIQIEADNNTGIIYFVTNDYQVFSVADNGTKKNNVNLKNVREIAIDYKSNLFYYDDKKDLYICNLNHGGIQKIEGIPKPNKIKLIRPMFAQEDGVFAVIDDVLYLLNADKTAEKSKVSFEVKPTAYAPEATLIQYYAFEKKIYEFNVLELVVTDLEELKNFLDDKRNEIQNIATKSRSSFGA